MKLKTKIFTLLPYWLIAMILIVSAQAFFDVKPSSVQDTSTIKPLVLGATTDIRGVIPESSPLTKTKEPEVLGISAQSFLVFDLKDGKELLSKNSGAKLYIASLTKLLTGLAVYRNFDLSKDIVVDYADQINISPIINITIGDTVKSQDVFNAMLVGSCNDAALTLANHTEQDTGKKFVDLMNSLAKSLGMEHSNFSNPLGFDSQYNYSTAEDLKKLIIETEKLAIFKNLGRRESYSFTGKLNYKYSTQATNKIIASHPDLSAIKTGYTKGAGEAMATKLSYNGHEVAILVLESKDREGDTIKLRKAVLDSYR